MLFDETRRAVEARVVRLPFAMRVILLLAEGSARQIKTFRKSHARLIEGEAKNIRSELAGQVLGDAALVALRHRQGAAMFRALVRTAVMRRIAGAGGGVKGRAVRRRVFVRLVAPTAAAIVVGFLGWLAVGEGGSDRAADRPEERAVAESSRAGSEVRSGARVDDPGGGGGAMATESDGAMAGSTTVGSTGRAGEEPMGGAGGNDGIVDFLLARIPLLAEINYTDDRLAKEERRSRQARCEAIDDEVRSSRDRDRSKALRAGPKIDSVFDLWIACRPS